jgi:hypothetical protein
MVRVGLQLAAASVGKCISELTRQQLGRLVLETLAFVLGERHVVRIGVNRQLFWMDDFGRHIQETFGACANKGRNPVQPTKGGVGIVTHRGRRAALGFS